MSTQRAAIPILSGIIPPLANPYLARTETGFGLVDGPRPGETIVLADSAAALATQAGGTGKTQLAASFAHSLRNTRAVDVLVWVPAASREAILASFAQAAGELDEHRPGETADAAARRFLDWLSRTRRRWAAVLDDVKSAADLEGLWPAGETGQVVVTTRLPEATLRGSGRTVLPAEGFSRREAVAYLNTRLADYSDQRIESFDLAEDVGEFPVAIAQAAAVIVESDTTCRDYRLLYAERLRNIEGLAVPGCPPETLATWSLAVELANELPPAGFAWPTLAFASVLGPGGIPAAVLASPAACGYITGRPPGSGAADQNVARAAIGNLEKLGLVSVDTTSAARTVWVHAAVQAAARAHLPATEIEQVVMAAATALLEAWPENATGHQLSQALRDCAASLSDHAKDLLWKPEAHPLLLRAGLSLEDGMLAESAIAYWESMAATSIRMLGRGHAQSVMTHDRLAAAYQMAGREAEAIAMHERTLAESERALGPAHPDTLAARGSLANAYRLAGKLKYAVAQYERVLSERERVQGADHPDTLTARGNLAFAHRRAGKLKEAIPEYERTLADRERVQGPDHRDTITARANLAGAYQLARRLADAIPQYKRAVADSERVIGPGHIDTLTTRCNLATAYYAAGRLTDAVAVLRRALADCERYLGPDHPMTNTVRENLQAAAD
ncbi:MAG TPA: tetratricopeptide repeat protein [Trebonia sp.]